MQEELEEVSEKQEEEEKGPGYVYIIRMIGSNHFKIGYTKDEPTRRLKELKTGSPFGNKIVLTFRGTMRDEKKLHEVFSRFRNRDDGEWFELSDHSLFSIIINTFIEYGRVSHRPESFPQRVAQFIEDNFFVSPRKPEIGSQFAMSLEDVYGLYMHYCDTIHIPVEKYADFRKLMMESDFGRRRYNGDLIFSLVQKPDSMLYIPEI